MKNAQDMRDIICMRICEIVNDKGPMRATLLAVEVLAEIGTGDHGLFEMSASDTMLEFPQLLEECVAKGGVVLLQYTLPATDYKVSQLLFPKGTVFTCDSVK